MLQDAHDAETEASHATPLKAVRRHCLVVLQWQLQRGQAMPGQVMPAVALPAWAPPECGG